MPEAIGLRALGRETEARETVERCQTIAGHALAMKNYDERWNIGSWPFAPGFLDARKKPTSDFYV
jgi:hypothetical protein